MTDQAMNLYALLPAVYRLRDAERGYPLRALVEVIAGQVDLLKDDIDGLWDDLFIETCDRWVIPYIGELVGNNLLHGVDPSRTRDTARQLFPDLRGPDLLPGIAIRTRADVGKTIYYRRRKGTPPMLEELARDVTGWAAHAVEFFKLLDWTQNLNHLRFHALECPDLRRVEPLDRLDGPFDFVSHTADVRPIGQREGWYNIKNIGFFLWRLRSYPLNGVEARRVSVGPAWQYHFSPLGNPAPLFTAQRREADESGVATELHVPGPLRPALFHTDLQEHLQQEPIPPKTETYGPFNETSADDLADQSTSLFVVRNGADVPLVDPATSLPQVVCRNLDPWPAARPAGQVIAIDVHTGRLAVGAGWGNPPADELRVSYHYGFSADLGGGPYERRKWLVAEEPGQRIRVRKDGAGDAATVAAALAAWNPAINTIIEIQDSSTYDLPAAIQLNNANWLVIEAANGQRPHLRTVAAGLEVRVSPPPAVVGDRQGSLTLSGLLVEGFVHVTGDLGRLRILHSTLVPGRTLDESNGRPATTEPSLVVDGAANLNAQLRAEIAFSITGPLRLPEHAEHLVLLDSIVDGILDTDTWGTAVAATGTSDDAGPPATLERVTFFGPSYFNRLELATEAIFTRPVKVRRGQDGCVRFSYVAPGSKTPRRYRCQPDLKVDEAIEAAAASAPLPLTDAQRDAIRQQVESQLTPNFTSVQYGKPAYAQLRLDCPLEIRTGGEDGAELGAMNHLKQPQRETNLRIRLEEYLPFGLDAGLIYVT